MQKFIRYLARRFALTKTGKLDRNQAGFTLLELMMALAILGIGILAILSLHVSSIQQNDNALSFTDAALANQGQIESFIMAAYGDINNDSPDTADGYTEVLPGATTQLASGYNLTNVLQPGYTLEYRVTNLIDLDVDGTDDAKEINLRVKDSNGDIRSNLTFVKTRI